MLEQEHPIPQQISAYQFRLVGDMTLNQFFQVAGGALISLAIYSSSLPAYFKWPLILISFLMGIAFAFFPLQDRPLATWIVLFFKAIYSPTIYVWRKGAEKRDFFVSENTTAYSAPTVSGQNPPTGTAEPTRSASVPASDLETKEAEFLLKVDRQLESPALLIPPPVPSAPSVPPATTVPVAVEREKVLIPQQTSVKVDVSPDEIKNVVEANMKPTDLNENFVPAVSQQLTGVKPASFVPEASPPLPPNIANVIVGQVLDPNGKIIDSAIIEILDTQSRPLRALKSNKLGHFMIVTPLANGNYSLITERDGYVFDPLGVECKGEIVSPIAIIAKNVLS